mmetsp:Transcript_49054/g.106528  ORF Transcript_49054/g.106528 Transcript_49054/m.106528 type:complete len:211 (+) Transcript_49054:426-1058(+)
MNHCVEVEGRLAKTEGACELLRKERDQCKIEAEEAGRMLAEVEVRRADATPIISEGERLTSPDDDDVGKGHSGGWKGNSALFVVTELASVLGVSDLSGLMIDPQSLVDQLAAAARRAPSPPQDTNAITENAALRQQVRDLVDELSGLHEQLADMKRAGGGTTPRVVHRAVRVGGGTPTKLVGDQVLQRGQRGMGPPLQLADLQRVLNGRR